MNNNKNEFSTLIKVKVEATINDPLKLTEIFYVMSQDNYHSLINDIKNDPEFFLNRNNNIQDFSLEKLDFENSKITVLDLVKEKGFDFLEQTFPEYQITGKVDLLHYLSIPAIIHNITFDYRYPVHEVLNVRKFKQRDDRVIAHYLCDQNTKLTGDLKMILKSRKKNLTSLYFKKNLLRRIRGENRSNILTN
jgi:hypothetical protein